MRSAEAKNNATPRIAIFSVNLPSFYATILYYILVYSSHLVHVNMSKRIGGEASLCVLNSQGSVRVFIGWLAQFTIIVNLTFEMGCLKDAHFNKITIL